MVLHLPATIVWIAAMLVIAWDFAVLQGLTYTFRLVNIVGISLVSAGVSLRVTARLTLGRQFTHGLRIAEGHALVTEGIYRRVRHPAYAGALLVYFGTPLIFGSTVGLLIMFPPLAVLILYRIRVEERMLAGHFGQSYQEYQRTSWKLIPFLH